MLWAGSERLFPLQLHARASAPTAGGCPRSLLARSVARAAVEGRSVAAHAPPAPCRTPKHAIAGVATHRHGVEATRRHPDLEQRARLRHELLHAAIGVDVGDVHALVRRALHADLARLAVLGEAVADADAVLVIIGMQ
jgi:hypothetical protein